MSKQSNYFEVGMVIYVYVGESLLSIYVMHEILSST